MTEAAARTSPPPCPDASSTAASWRAVAAVAALGPTAAAAAPASPAADPAAAGRWRREAKRIKLYAEKLADGQRGYGLEKGKATVPGPLIELVEGDTLHIEFENTMDVESSLHVHGLDYDVANDGTKMNHSSVEPGGTRTYTWRTHAPGRRKDGSWRPGSAGYWHYHDHAVGTEHGTGGIRAGMYGPAGGAPRGRPPARQAVHHRLQRHDDQQPAEGAGLQGHRG